MTISMRNDPFPIQGPYHGIYAHGVETPGEARMLHISGQVGVTPDGDLAEGFRGQCRQALKNVEAVLVASRMHFYDIVKMTFYLTRRQDMDTLVDIRKECLDGVRPAVTTLFVTGLVQPEWLVEIEAVACAQSMPRRLSPY